MLVIKLKEVIGKEAHDHTQSEQLFNELIDNLQDNEIVIDF